MSVLTAAEVKRAAFGNSAQTTTADEDSDIADIVAAIDKVIEERCGLGAVPGAIATWTTTARGGAIVLPWRYRLISSVTVDGGSALSSTLYATHRAASGILDGVYGVYPWAAGSLVTVAAVVGPETVDPRVERGAYLLARHWWQLGRQGGRAGWAQENGYPVDAAVPKEALAILPPNLAGIG